VTSDLLTEQLQDALDIKAGGDEAMKEVVADKEVAVAISDVCQAAIDRIVAAAEAMRDDNPDNELIKLVLEQKELVKAKVLEASPAGVKMPPKPEPTPEEKEFEELVDREFASNEATDFDGLGEDSVGKTFTHYDEKKKEITTREFFWWLVFASANLWCCFWLIGYIFPQSYTFPLVGGLFVGYSWTGGISSTIKSIILCAYLVAGFRLFALEDCLQHKMTLRPSAWKSKDQLREWLKARIDLRPDAQSLGKLKHWNPKIGVVHYRARYVSRMGRRFDEVLSTKNGAIIAAFFMRKFLYLDGLCHGWLMMFWRSDCAALFRGKPREKYFQVSRELASQILNPNVLRRGSTKEITTARIIEICKGTHSVNLSKYLPLDANYLIARTQEFAYAVWADMERDSEMIPFPTNPVA
jgi:hypothetical protein